MRERVEAVVAEGANPAVPNRYVAASRSHPDKLASRWNHTRLLTVPEPRGGALLIHGLTDSPYSMRALAERMHAAGYYTLSLRMQGHGTVPGGLVNTTWEDWSAAVRMGARHMRQADRSRSPAGARRVLEWRRARDEVRAGRARRCHVAAAGDADSPVPDDRRVAGGAAGRGHQPAGPAGRQGALDRCGARVQPVQVQLVSRERGGADRAAHARARQPAGAGGTGRPCSTACRPCWHSSRWWTRR